jgi:hypothetical protein
MKFRVTQKEADIKPLVDMHKRKAYDTVSVHTRAHEHWLLSDWPRIVDMGEGLPARLRETARIRCAFHWLGGKSTLGCKARRNSAVGPTERLNGERW